MSSLRNAGRRGDPLGRRLGHGIFGNMFSRSGRRARRRHASGRGGREGVLCGYLDIFCRLRCSGSASD